MPQAETNMCHIAHKNTNISIRIIYVLRKTNYT